MATRKHHTTDTDVYDKLLAAQQRSVAAFRGPRYVLDKMLNGEPVVVPGWRIHRLPAYGWFEVHPDGRTLPAESPVVRDVRERRARILAAED